MKRKILLGSSLILCSLILGSCAQGNEIDPDTPQQEVVTGVTINGASFVFVGETTTFTADVLGTSDDRVTWEVSDEEIATISSQGEVRGIKEGEVTIKATSVLDPSFSSQVTLVVRSRSSESIHLVIEGSQDITQESDGTYLIPAGQSFRVSYRLDDENSRVPDGVTYSITSEDTSVDTTNFATFEYVGDGSCIITTNSVFERAILSMRATYGSTTSGALTDYVYISSIDLNEDNKAQFNEIMERISLKEKESLVSASYSRVNQGVTYLSEFDIYSNATYGRHYENETMVEKTYASLDGERDIFYYFSYNNDLTIDEIYMNSNQDVSSEENSSLAHFMIDGLPSFGFSSNLSAIGSEATYRGFTSLGDFTSNAYATFEFTSTSVTIKSTYSDFSDINRNLEFNLVYNSDYEIESYSFVSQVEENGEYIDLYREYSDDFTYGTKVSDSTRENEVININNYYISSFTMRSIGGLSEYGYSSDTYLYDSFDEATNTYSIRFNHSMALMVDNIVPSSGTTLIDSISGSSYYEVDGVRYTRSLNVYDNGISSFGAPKGEDGMSLETTEYCTFTSRGGGTFNIVVNWSRPTLNAINVDIYGVTQEEVEPFAGVWEGTINQEEIELNLMSSGKAILNGEESDEDYVVNGNTITFTLSNGEREVTLTYDSLNIQMSLRVEESGEVILEGLLNEFTKEQIEISFPSIRVGGKSNYFFVNGDPDSSDFTFNMRVVEGEQDGILLKQYSDENISSYPGFSYYLEGVKEGTYVIEFYSPLNQSVVSNRYRIVVDEPISRETYISNLVGESFVYSGLSNGDVTLSFVSDTLMTLTHNGITQNINITMMDGRVIVDGYRQTFDNESFYFESILGYEDDPMSSNDQNFKSDNIIISEDFSSIRLPLRVRDNEASSELISGYANYAYYTFSKQGVSGDLEGRSFESSPAYSITLQAMVKGTISFTSQTSGTIKIEGAYNSVNYAEFTFSYQIVDGVISLSDVTNTSQSNVIFQEFFQVSQGTYRLRFHTTSNSTNDALDFTIN